MHRLDEDRSVYPLIYVIEEGVYGVALSYGAFASMVRYTVNGIEYDGVFMGNDEFLVMHDTMIEYEEV